MSKKNVIFVSISVSRVTTDGESHGVLTLVVCVSGVVVATILVSLIVFMLRKTTRSESVMMKSISEKVDIESQRVSEVPKPKTSRPKMRIFAIFGSKKQSFDLE